MKTTKDPMIVFRSTQAGFNSKGGARLTLTIGGDKATGNEALEQLIAVLTEYKTNPRGVKIDIHTSKKEYEGRSFDSTIAFVRPVQEFGAQGRTSFRPVAGAPSAIADKVNTFKAAQVK